MFNKLKNVKDLYSQSKQLKKTLADENVTVEKNNITLVMDGNMEIISIKFDKQADINTLETSTKEAVNEAIKKAQQLMAKKFQEMGGMPNMF
ncbi:YbaB/EbfC family nucleoid-associated protein [bacterium]|nr:YbaB/EbfC family nucleoid-associated protein [bacterium]